MKNSFLQHSLVFLIAGSQACAAAETIEKSVQSKTMVMAENTIPTDPILSEGEALEGQQAWAAAIALYTNYLSTHPNRIDLWLRISDIQANQLDNPKASAEAYSRILTQQPTNAKAWFRLNQKWQLADQPTKALEALNKAIQFDAQQSYYEERLKLDYWLGLQNELEATFTYLLTKDPENQPALLARARYYWEKGDWVLAANSAYACLNHNPNDELTFEWYVKALANSGKTEDALKFLTTHSQSISKQDAEKLMRWLQDSQNNQRNQLKSQFAWLNNEAKPYHLDQQFNALTLPKAALLAEDKKNVKQAITIYHQLVQQNPGLWEAWLRLALLYSYEKNDKSAAEAFIQLSHQFPKNLSLYQAAVTHLIAAKQFPEAIIQLDKLIALDNDKKKRLEEKAYLQIQLHDLKGAYQTYSTLSKLDPANLGYIKQKKNLMISLKNPGLAYAAELELLRLEPDNLIFLNEKINLLLQMNQPEKAIEVYNQIIQRRPDDPRWQLAKAKLLQNLHRNQEALVLYQNILNLHPNNQAALEGMILLYMAENNLNKALKLNKSYLSHYPADKAALIRNAYLEMWVGAYQQSENDLGKYIRQFGSDLDLQKALARLYSVGGRPGRARQLAAPLLESHPNDIEILLTKTYADYNALYTMDALADLQKLNQLAPDNASVQQTNKEILTPLRSSIAANGLHFRGSDTVTIDRGGLTGHLYRNPVTTFDAGLSLEQITAAAESGFTPINGCCGLNFVNAWLGSTHRFSPHFFLDGRLGINQIEGINSNFYYLVDGQVRVNDYLHGNLLSSRTLYDASPLAVSLKVNQNLNRLNINLQPTLQTFIDLRNEYSTFSDSNRQWLTEIYPHMVVFNNQSIKIDFGVDSLLFGFSKDLNNGYYDPSLYQFYSLVGTLYWAASENSGFFIRADAGQQKDNFFSKFKFASDLSLDAIYGFYDNWYLDLGASYSQRLTSSASTFTNPNKPYSAYNIRAELKRRF